MIKQKVKKLNTHLGELAVGQSLKAKVTLGTLWLGGGSTFEQGLRFIRNMILTRILAPEVFGIMAIILAVKMAVQSMTEVGIKKAVIQNPRGGEKTYLNGAWWLSLIRGILIYVVAYFAIPWIANFYENPQLTLLMRIGFLSILLDGLTSPRAYVAIKKMNFKHWMIIFHGGSALGIVTAVILAFFMRNAWALVIGLAVESLARCVLSYVVCPFCPGIHFNKRDLHALFKYVRGVFGLGILYFIFMRADVFVIGKLCSRSDLGLYSMALALAQTPFQLITALMDQMAMPVFSKIQNDNQRINQVIMLITAIILYTCFPLLVFLILHGGDVLHLIYGAQYARVAVPFALIFCTWLIRFCSMPIVQLYFALGRPELHRAFTGIRTICILVLIYHSVKWFGLVGAAAASLIAMIIGYIFQIIRLHKLTKLDLFKYSMIFIRTIALSCFILIIWAVVHSSFVSTPIIRMIPGALGCLLVYSYFIFEMIKVKDKSEYTLVTPFK